MNLEERRPRLPALTSLRFFAAFHVMLFHTQPTGAVFGPTWFRRLSSIGYVGVSFFFVLSGFILVYTYAGRPMSAASFWRARFARIYPAYAFALLLTLPFFVGAALHFAGPKGAFIPFEVSHLKLTVALEVLLLQAWVPPIALSWNPVGWSLSVEAFFYLLFPFLLFRYERLSRKQLFTILVVCWVASNAISAGYTVLKPDGVAHPDAYVYTSWMNAVKFLPLARLPEFLMGMAAGFLFLRTRRNQRAGVPLIGAGVVAIMMVAMFAVRIPFAVLHTALLSPAFAAIVYGTALRPQWTSVLENRVLVLFGDASYSMYLIHANIVFSFFHTAKGDVRNASFAGLALCLVIVLSIAILIYRFVEQPARRKLRQRPTAKPAFVTAMAAGVS